MFSTLENPNFGIIFLIRGHVVALDNISFKDHSFTNLDLDSVFFNKLGLYGALTTNRRMNSIQFIKDKNAFFLSKMIKHMIIIDAKT